METQFPVINLVHVRAIGTFNDPNGKYFMLNFSFTAGSDISWKYDSKEKRDEKFNEAKSLLGK
ncbi:MAG: hypothetical protein JNK43_02955 [Ignavibacteria bacterium]|nr:hypothetical protein [Ignavibacteria bacterium]